MSRKRFYNTIRLDHHGLPVCGHADRDVCRKCRRWIAARGDRKLPLDRIIR